MKHLKTFLLLTVFCFSFSIGSSFGQDGDDVEGYEMKDLKCSSGEPWKVCREEPNATCSVSDQTVC
ncbi:hypothetical protein SAMN06295967_101154 [Belliella buryatensis]|uniref:NVEALA protein n=1 Tax=Belliella buryatensis TaxID=1500549 RepID=A0A239AHK4_9BACT|nr:hypothetical protein SAMN06295967_101154 [Belliella buryatensis]